MHPLLVLPETPNDLSPSLSLLPSVQRRATLQEYLQFKWGCPIPLHKDNKDYKVSEHRQSD